MVYRRREGSRASQLSPVVKVLGLPPVWDGGNTGAAPVNLTLPTISGTAQVGQTLTRVVGTWSGTGNTYTHQWRANGAAISGATTTTYVPVVGDVGKAITVTTTATNTGGSASATSAPTVAVASAGGVAAPVNTAVPTISGVAQVGQTLTASQGSWSNSPTSYSYQWSANGTPVSGATASTYGPVTGDIGKTITVTSTATNAGGSASSTSAATGAVSAAALINMTGAAARVAITDASYWIRTGGTLARSTDTTYETNLKNSSTAKTIPIAGSQTIPAGSIGYVSIKHADVTADVSPPLFINWDGNSALPSAASPLVPTVWYSSDSVTGSPDDGTWTQDTSFVPYRPTAATDATYGGRGQRYFWPTASARWVQVRWDVTVAGMTQAVVPHIACSSGQWAGIFGMSIIRNQYSSISTVNAARAAVIAANSGADPFFFVPARAGANQQAILDEQVSPFLNTPGLRKFIRAIYVNPWINDLAFSGVRPYSAATQAVRDAIGQRSATILSGLKSLGLTLVVSDCTYGNYSTATPAVNGDVSSANGNLPYITNVLGPVHKAQVPSSFDPAYDWPYVSQYASMGNTFETAMADEVHPNGTGYTPQFKTTENPNWRMLYGQAPGANTMQSIISGLGSSTTIVKKARAQAVFDALVAAYPTSDSAANSNRATLRSQLDALAAA